ncbi:lactonase family protein, partial [Candidatus Sumerlaeota bacterium]|nr:lactonase family protein [Candidatus Sumerlaeota bacterium]
MRVEMFMSVVGLLIVPALVAAESIPVYFGTYTAADGASKGIYRSTFDLETGKLSDPILVAETRNPSFVAIHQTGRFLYAVSEMGGSGGVSAFAIVPESGELKLLNQQPSGGAGPCHVNIDLTGKNVLVANYSSGSASVIPIQPDGKLGTPTCVVQHEGSSVNPKRQAGPHAHSINVSPDNRFAFVADLGLDKVMIYRLDADKGTIVANKPAFASVKPGAGPRHFAFHPSGEFAYVINELACTITAFSYDSVAGALTEIQTITTLPEGFSGTSSCAEVRVHPNGKFLYGSNRGHDSIAAYWIDPEKGTLTFVAHQGTDIKTPRNFNIDPSGKFCLVAN